MLMYLDMPCLEVKSRCGCAQFMIKPSEFYFIKTQNSCYGIFSFQLNEYKYFFHEAPDSVVNVQKTFKIVYTLMYFLKYESF